MPEHIISKAEPWRLFYGAGAIMDQYAESRSGSAFDPDRWESALVSLDFDLAMLVHFMGTWENSGSFVNEAVGWFDEQTRIKRALITFGCERAAALYDEARELGMQIEHQFASDQDITPEQLDRREQINQAANEDVSYEKLAAFIRERYVEFLG